MDLCIPIVCDEGMMLVPESYFGHKLLVESDHLFLAPPDVKLASLALDLIREAPSKQRAIHLIKIINASVELLVS